MKTRVIFVCIHNSGRSQMAEGFLRYLAADRFEVMSAGIESGTLNPYVVKAMAEDGVDISGHFAKTAQSLIDRGERFDYIVTVCDETNAERCPYFPGNGVRLHWGFPDPSAIAGTEEEKLAGIRPIRDAIRSRIVAWISEIRQSD